MYDCGEPLKEGVTASAGCDIFLSLPVFRSSHPTFVTISFSVFVSMCRDMNIEWRRPSIWDVVLCE